MFEEVKEMRQGGQGPQACGQPSPPSHMERLPMAGVAGKVDHKRGQAHGSPVFYFFSIPVEQ